MSCCPVNIHRKDMHCVTPSKKLPALPDASHHTHTHTHITLTNAEIRTAIIQEYTNLDVEIQIFGRKKKKKVANRAEKLSLVAF